MVCVRAGVGRRELEALDALSDALSDGLAAVLRSSNGEGLLPGPTSRLSTSGQALG
jgi:hypothetical protein